MGSKQEQKAKGGQRYRQKDRQGVAAAVQQQGPGNKLSPPFGNKLSPPFTLTGVMHGLIHSHTCPGGATRIQPYVCTVSATAPLTSHVACSTCTTWLKLW